MSEHNPLNLIIKKLISIIKYLKIIFIDCIGDFLMASENMQKVVFFFVVAVIILIWNPNDIQLNISNITKFIVGMFFLAVGYNGTTSYRRTDKVSASVFVIIIGLLLILWALGFLNV